MTNITTGIPFHAPVPFATDSYKLTHWPMYPDDMQVMSSYYEMRKGAQFQSGPFFGMQARLLECFVGKVLTLEDIDEAYEMSKFHFGSDTVFNIKGWQRLFTRWGGLLPVTINALPEGSIVNPGVQCFNVQNTDHEFPWLTNLIEGRLMHEWYTDAVCAKSYACKQVIAKYLRMTTGGIEGLLFMLQDFGYRGATCDNQAARGGAAHLINFLGTDTLVGLRYLKTYYGASYADGIGYSVPATEHSVMCLRGRAGESALVGDLIRKVPTGVLSVVADTYDIYNFTSKIVGEDHREAILARDGVFVVRPDSITPLHPTPEALMVDLAERLWAAFGGTVNHLGYRVLDSHVRLLWGDGIDLDGIEKILAALAAAGFAACNVACFGMGGGLLQKVNRDTQRCAIKASAIMCKHEWKDVYKEPLDTSKASKRGRLKTVRDEATGTFVTVPLTDPRKSAMWNVFENGELTRFQTLAEIRERAGAGF